MGKYPQLLQHCHRWHRFLNTSYVPGIMRTSAYTLSHLILKINQKRHYYFHLRNEEHKAQSDPVTSPNSNSWKMAKSFQKYFINWGGEARFQNIKEGRENDKMHARDTLAFLAKTTLRVGKRERTLRSQ